VRRVALAGSVPETVARYADDPGADLIVLGTGSSPWWNRFWKKSAAAALASETDRPIWLANLSPAATATDFQSLLCLVALDGTDDPLVRFSEEMAQRFDATLMFLHVLPDVSEGLIAHGIPGVDDRPLSRGVAEKRLREVTAGLSVPHVAAITTGSAYRSVATLVREQKADLVITGRHNGGVSGLDTGALLSRVSCPVISVAAGAGGPIGARAVFARPGAREISLVR
jgi:nucleotide-binding universal stress UspA family protein